MGSVIKQRRLEREATNATTTTTGMMGCGVASFKFDAPCRPMRKRSTANYVYRCRSAPSRSHPSSPTYRCFHH